MTDELKERVKALAIQHLRQSANGHTGDDFDILEFAQAVARDCAMLCKTTPPDPFRPSIEAAHAIRLRYGLEA